ncbi:PQQ-binding-like beta-propeller repeat protein [Wukongibacter baidiensis]|uniref:outer membrane protein assembly factor BamB family protein n=1 Tax=Wukongibacter baidiensis TaxID=1723361 RepID=UPI003D7F4154
MNNVYGKWLLFFALILIIFYFPGKNDKNRQQNHNGDVEVFKEFAENEDHDTRKIDFKFRDEDIQYKLALQKSNAYKKVIEKEKSINDETRKIDKEILKKIDYQTTYVNKQSEKNYDQDMIHMDSSDDYSDVKGITCFRGNNFRNSPSYGFVEMKEKKLEIIWKVPIGYVDRWSGVGWNGQPAIVEWSDELLKNMNIFEEKKNKDSLKEVIYGTLDSNIYFLDLEDGSFTRNKIKVPGPIKGSITVDPRGIPLLYAGQGINKVNGKIVRMGYRIFNLIDQSMMHFINGRDKFAYRGWSAFDSTSIIDKKTDRMIICGENGIVYNVKLNTQYDRDKKELSLDPEISKYRYKIEGNGYQGIENSIAVYRNLGFFADNGGWIQCIDLNSLKPRWIYNATDDTDSTIVIDEEADGSVALYTACEVDKQGAKGKSYIRRLNAISGELIWEKSFDCYSKLGEWPNNGGALATPVIGKKSIENMVIYNLARYGGFNRGLLIALDKKTGDELWRLELKNYSWSSPVDIYTKEGEAFILLCDSGGRMYLIEGMTGQVVDQVALGSNVEGSPAVYENIAVVGTRGQKIFGIRIK